MEIVHCFIALGEVCRDLGRSGPSLSAGMEADPLPPAPCQPRLTCCSFCPAARSYPKELMKFFFSQVEMSKEAIRVGTLALIRAIVSADGEPAGVDRHHGQSAGGNSDVPIWFPPYFCSHCWVVKSLDCFVFLSLKFNQYRGPSIPLPSGLDFHS